MEEAVSTEIDDYRSVLIGLALARLPEEDYQAAITALEQHEGCVRLEEGPDGVVIVLNGRRLVKVDRLSFIPGRFRAPTN
jgi:hypothetical protein